MNRHEQSSLYLPFFTELPPQGLSYPTDVYEQVEVDLDAQLLSKSRSHFFVQVAGKSMVNAGILDKAILLVDKERPPRHDDIVIADLDGVMTCRILDTRAQMLRSANLNYKPISVRDGKPIEVLGVVTHAINPLLVD